MDKHYNTMNSSAAVVIKWDAPMLKRFKHAFNEAQSRNADTFVFDNNVFTVGYAYYLIEYLTSRLGGA
jgi:hypothetical protein